MFKHLDENDWQLILHYCIFFGVISIFTYYFLIDTSELN